MNLRGWKLLLTAAVFSSVVLYHPAQSQVNNKFDQSKATEQNSGKDASKCDDTSSSNGPDICAQWVAANAARRSAEIAQNSLNWTIASFIALIITLLASILSARAALRANKINQDANIVDQRAWLDVKLVMLGEFRIDPNGGVSAYVGAEITNIGKTPALDIYTNIELECKSGYDKHQELLEDFCDKSKRIDTIFTRGLLPGQSYVRKWAPSQDDVKGEFGSVRPIFPSIMVCVTYKTMFSSDKHQTAFSQTVVSSAEDRDFSVLTYAHSVLNKEEVAFESDGSHVIT